MTVIRLAFAAIGIIFVGSAIHVALGIPRNAAPPPAAIMAMIGLAATIAALWR
jgi:hypothetical protein